MKFFTVLILLFFYTFISYSFQGDTAASVSYDASMVQFLTENQIDYGEKKLTEIDTTVNLLHLYNPIHKNIYHYKYLGNLGTAYQSIIFNFKNNIGIDLGMEQFQLYSYNNQYVRYYNTAPRFTNLTYVLGAKKEQLFKVLHTQNVNPYFNIGLNYQRISSDGFYQRQKTEYDNLSFFSWYSSPNQRYNLISNASLNSIKVQENGGATNKNIFDAPAAEDRQLEQINLDEAENRTRSKSFYIRQYFDTGYKIQKQTDSLLTDSFIGTNRFSHSFAIENQSLVYDDKYPFSGFYDSAFFDSSNIRKDSIFFYKIENELSWINLPVKHSSDTNVQVRKIRMGLKLKHTYWNFVSPYTSRGYNFLMQNYSVSALLGNNKKNMKWNVKGEYIIGGTNAADYSVDGSIEINVDKKSNFLKLAFSNCNKSASLISNEYSFNFFKWQNNNFKKVNYSSVILSNNGNSPIVNLAIKYSVIDNYVYYDTTAIPRQHNNSLNLIQIFVSKNFRLKHFHFNNYLVYQKPSDAYVIRIPDIYFRNSIYYENTFFKGALFAQIGIDVFYYTSYQSETYMPATRQFYHQNNIEVGNYPVFDFFVNGKVKNARLFIKMEHINQGIIAHGYYGVPGYPMPDRTIKFGVNWMFLD